MPEFAPDPREVPGALGVTESATCAVDAAGVIVAVNAAWEAFQAANGGVPIACGVGVNYLAVCEQAVGDRRAGSAQVADGLRMVLSGTATRFERVYPCHAPDLERWFIVRVLAQPDGSGAVVSHHDVTDIKLEERAVSGQTMLDAVTGLPNRALLVDRLEQALAQAHRSRQLVAVGFLDLDGFHDVNASWGRAAGDELLNEVAARLGLRLRDGDTLARLDDDKFVVVWCDLTDAAGAHELSGLLTHAFDAPFLLAGTAVAVTASIGISVDPWAQTPDDLLLAAEAAMYDAKRRGPGQLQVVTQGPPSGDVERIRSEASLREAMYRNELVVHYQPVVDLTGGDVVGVEALVRWEHPTDGLLAPDLFIPVAESSGLIVSLGAWVLEVACAQAVAWRAAGLRLDIAVNLSTRQVAHPDLVRSVVRVLRETSLDPQHLVLEVTESAVMEDAEAAVAVLGRIAGLGVSLSIDDFGTGYSSLVYLKRYPIRALKIDRSFIAGMGQSDEDDAIVASVIGLARAVGGSCVAEGVETVEQFAALRALGCGYGQGWLFGRAVPAAELPALVQQCERELAARLLTMPLVADQRDQAGERRDLAAEQRDQAADERDQVGDQRDQVGDQRDEVGDQRDQAGDQRDQAGDQRDQAGERRDLAGDVRDLAADQRDVIGEQRDLAGDARDLAADQRDEVGGRRDLAGDVRDLAADQRDEVGERRDLAGDVRDLAAEQRDLTAEQRDLAAEQRDLAADRRDQSAEHKEVGAAAGAPIAGHGQAAMARQEAASDRTRALLDRQAGAGERILAEQDRGRALADRGAGAEERTLAEQDRGTALADRGAGAEERTLAEHDRDTALADRGAGASERTQAEHDRDTALADRGASATERDAASLDALTGVYTRGSGFGELEREIARARRTGQPLVVAFVDVDRLKATNDTRGHAAGDRMLVGIAKTLAESLRSYDLVMRYGGDEFVCALPGLTLADAQTRLLSVHEALAESAERGSITVGFAELLPSDTLADLVGRADAALYQQRREQRRLPP